MNKDIGLQRFLLVKEALNRPETRLAYNFSFKRPFRFYKEHSVEEAINILLEETSSKITNRPPVGMVRAQKPA